MPASTSTPPPASMPVQHLGDTGLTVSRLGLGLAALGRPGYITLDHAHDLPADRTPDTMARHAHQVLDAAWTGGIRYFDAARSYGLAEQFLAGWLEQNAHTPEDQVVASKWGYTYTAEWKIQTDVHEVKEHSAEVFARQWDKSKAELRDFLRIYQIHSATFDSGALQDPDVLAQMYFLKEQGVHVGVTLSGEEQAEAIVHVLLLTANENRLFDTIQATWNLLEPSCGNALNLAQQTGAGIIVKEVLANGRLTERNRAPDFAPKLRVLQEVAQELETTVDAVAIAAALHQPWAHVVLSGAATVEQINANLGALEVELKAEHWMRLAELAEPPSQYWQTRSRLAWN